MESCIDSRVTQVWSQTHLTVHNIGYFLEDVLSKRLMLKVEEKV